MKRAIRSLLLGLAWASLWPAYLVLLGQLAQRAPLPRNLCILGSTVLHGLALGAFLPAVLAWMTRRDGWSERFLGIPEAVGRQVCRTGRFLAVMAVIFLVPVHVLASGEFAPGGRPIKAVALQRVLVLGFELAVWGALVTLVRRRSPLLQWCDLSERGVPGEDGLPAHTSGSGSGSGSFDAKRSSAWPERISRHRRLVGWALVLLAAGVIVLDVRGYSFTARRLAAGSAATLGLFLACWAAHRGSCRLIARSAHRWGVAQRSASLVLVSAVALRGKPRTVTPGASGEGARADLGSREDLAARLSQLVFYVLIILAALGVAWIWELDLTLVRFLAGQTLWSFSDSPVTLGNLTTALAAIVLGSLAWRYMGAVFTLTLFPRMADDPGVRFAVVMLCRYAVLGMTAVIALGAIHISSAQIGMVVAALGVGLGFGLQEIVSNFVCGIIMLLERPVRIGDIVTVAGTTGKVDRIHIRATTIINGDNQSMIVPNREFITGNLVNWTHKDRILRVTIRVGVAYGSDPQQVVDLLLGIAAGDPDVLQNPPASALLEELGDSALKFALYTYVADPALVGAVRHRISAGIPRVLAGASIGIPYPIQELHIGRLADDLMQAITRPGHLGRDAGLRLDAASAATAMPHAQERRGPGRPVEPADRSATGAR